MAWQRLGQAGWFGTVAMVAALAACTPQPPVEPTLKPIARPETPQGLLRRDGGGQDTPFSAGMLVRNFEQIAFYNEYNATLTGRGDKSPMRRWERPVRMEVVFGDGVPPSERARDEASIKDYAARLAATTQHSVSVGGKPNFMVIVVGEDDRSDALALAAKRIPGVTAESLAALGDLRRDTYCVVAAYAGGADPNIYTAAVAVIRAENPSLMRLSCIHEELAQGLGLANDSPTARPSIFNDDDQADRPRGSSCGVRPRRPAGRCVHARALYA